jgi:hypothetical protein
VGTPRLSWRRLRVLLKHLPEDAATTQEVLGPAGTWNRSDYLLAAAIDQLTLANWQRAQVASKRSIPVPKPLPRPGDQPVGPGGRPLSDMNARMKAWRARHGRGKL